VCGCNRSVNVNDTDPRRRVRSAKPSQKPPSGPHTEPSRAGRRRAARPARAWCAPGAGAGAGPAWTGSPCPGPDGEPRHARQAGLTEPFDAPVDGWEVGPTLHLRPYPKHTLGLCASANSRGRATLPLRLVPRSESSPALGLLSILGLDQSPDFLRYRMNRLTILDRLSVLILIRNRNRIPFRDS
jgi:hypothetical protein